MLSSHEGQENLNGGVLPLGTDNLVVQLGQITFRPGNNMVSFASISDSPSGGGSRPSPAIAGIGRPPSAGGGVGGNSGPPCNALGTIWTPVFPT